MVPSPLSHRTWAEAIAAPILAARRVFGGRAPSPAAADGREESEAGGIHDIMQSPHEGVWRVDAAGKTVTVNGRMAEMLGCEPAQIVGRPALEFIDDKWLESGRDRFDQIRRGESMQFEVCLKRKDGSPLWTLMASHSLADARGEFRGAFGLFIDITEQHRTAQEQRHALSLLEATLESTADGILVVDADGRIVRHNDRFVRMWRIPAEVIESRDDSKAVEFVLSQLQEPEQFLSKIRDLYASPEEESFDTLRFKDGKVFERYSMPQRLGSEIIGRVWSFRDVSDRERAESEARLAMDRERRIAQNLDAALFRFVLGPDRRIERYEHFSLGAEILFGVPIADLQEKPSSWMDCIHPDDLREVVLPALDRVAKLQRTVLDFRYRTPTGVYRWHRSRLIPGTGPDGRIHVDGLETDVTDRFALEEQLRHSQKMEAVGRLAGGIAHDFNNILTAILGYSDLLLARLAPNDPSRKNIWEIRKAGERAAALTRQLLAFSRRARTIPRVVDLNATIRDLDPMIHRVINEDVTFEMSLDERIGRIRLDPSQLEQVVVNLVVNASDAMPRGGILRLSTDEVLLSEEDTAKEPALAPGPYVRLVVSDTGTGIRPDIAERIFEPFFTTKEMGRGTGLGLATAYGILIQHHGRIRVMDEVERGAAFEILLPRMEEEAEQIEATPDAVRGGNETILFVEDEPDLISLGRMVLQDYGYKVLTAENGAEAIEIAARAEDPIDLIVTDVVMPGMGGRELVERLRDTNPNVEALFVSGYTRDTVLLHGVEEEEFHFMEKPYTPQSLARAVQEILTSVRKSKELRGGAGAPAR